MILKLKKMKKFLINFLLFVYTEYVYEDFDTFTKIGKIFIYPFWFIRACIIWTISPVFIPIFFIKQSVWYKNIKKLMNSPEYQKYSYELMNKITSRSK